MLACCASFLLMGSGRSSMSFMILEGADNAVFLDGSDSATLYFDGKFIIRPGENKNEFLSVAVGFK